MELFTPELGLIFWMFVVFAILFIILAKFGWPVIIKMMEERADYIDKGVANAQLAQHNLDDAQSKAQEFIADAQKRQAEILREAAQMKTEIIEEAKKAAALEAKKVMDAASLSIEQQRKQSETQFRNEVSMFAIAIAEKMMRTKLSDDKSQSEMIDKFLNEIENKN